MLRNFVDIALFAIPIMNLNYTIFVDFFLYVKNIEHETLISFILLISM